MQRKGSNQGFFFISPCFVARNCGTTSCSNANSCRSLQSSSCVDPTPILVILHAFQMNLYGFTSWVPEDGISACRLYAGPVTTFDMHNQGDLFKASEVLDPSNWTALLQLHCTLSTTIECYPQILQPRHCGWLKGHT